MTVSPTGEQVEAAAIALYGLEYDLESYPWETEPEKGKDDYRHSARAALTAALARPAEGEVDADGWKDVMRELLSLLEDNARALYCRYDRETKSYVLTDKIWKEHYAHGFEIVQRARAWIK